MKDAITKSELLQSPADVSPLLLEDWIDPLETQVRIGVRAFIEKILRSELDEVLSRPRYGRRPATGEDGKAAASVAGDRHGSRERMLMGAFGKIEITVPRARLDTADGKAMEWRSKTLRAYQRRTVAAAT
jgi:putative transposase